ncbi:MAG: class II aldolase/adducin family protein [Alphaproteobacteria bacterium]|nr:class II aldolase/adducin family protein [Alphaproteobacteria bacterium]
MAVKQTTNRTTTRKPAATPASRRAPVRKADKTAVAAENAGTAPRTKSAAALRKAPRPRTASKAAETAARKAVIATALKMSRSGLSPGRSGNVSCRWKTGMLITPTGMAYEQLKPSDIAFVDADGSFSKKARKPSSEWRFHLAAYHARPDIGAVVHTHSLHATVLACANKTIPAFHYMIAVAGGVDIPIIPYAPFGTEELAGHVGNGLARRSALLMANHGQIAVGKNLAAALELAEEVEVLSEQFYKVLTLGKPRILDADAMADVLERFKGYGQNAQ